MTNADAQTFLTTFEINLRGHMVQGATVGGALSEDPRDGTIFLATSAGTYECGPSGNWITPDGEMVLALSHNSRRCPPWRTLGVGNSKDVTFI